MAREKLGELLQTDTFNAMAVEAVRGAMRLKIESGVEVPTYPQYRDMSRQFLEPITDEMKQEAPYLLRPEEAKIAELGMLDDVGREYEREHGKRLAVRVCVTGAIDLYLKAFGASNYTDLLYNIAQSVSRFTQHALRQRFRFDVEVVCFDEPSLGLNPEITFSDEEIIEAMEIQSKIAHRHGVVTQVHLHNPLHAPLFYQVDGIDVIGVESAASPQYLELFNKRELEDNGKTIRLGVARTDIAGIVAELNDRLGVNLWMQPERLVDEVLSMESADIIYNRLQRGWDMFQDTVSFVGPDCALGSWPSQNSAAGLLRNIRIAMDRFREERRSFS